MAIKQCPQCGHQYPLSSTRCPDCDIDLVERLAGDLSDTAPTAPGDGTASTIGDAIDQRATSASSGPGAGSVASTVSATHPLPTAERGTDQDAADGEDVGDPGDDQVTYEMGEWSAEARVMLEQLLAGASIARVWEGTDLVIRSVDEAAVDDLVEEVRSTDEPMLDPDAEKVVYEVNDWTTEQLVTLTDGLMERGIGYQFDVEGDLVVLATDEAGVEALLDVIEFGPAPEVDPDSLDDPDGALDDTDDPDDGLVTAEILSELFVACDKLQKNARDADAVLGVVATADKLAGRALPFGYEPPVWEGMVGAAAALRDDLEGDEATDDDLEAKARALRDRLREYV